MTPTHRAAYAKALGRVLAMTPAQLRQIAPSKDPESTRDRLMADCHTVPCAVLEKLDAIQEAA